MAKWFFILYPKKASQQVKVVRGRPNPKTCSKKYGFAEGGFKNSSAVVRRLNWMNVPMKRRPKYFRHL